VCYVLSFIKICFKDREIVCLKEIITLERDQIDEIRSWASDYELSRLKQKKYGLTLSYLTDTQKTVVLSTKNSIMAGKTGQEMKDEKTVKISEHFVERLSQRIGSDKKAIIIQLIEKVRDTNIVNKAQFKGYPHLSYTVTKNGDPDEYTFAIAFMRLSSGKHRIQIITVHLKNDEPEETEWRVSEYNDEYAKTLAKLEKFVRENDFKDEKQ
jgi:hypothetical protein